MAFQGGCSRISQVVMPTKFGTQAGISIALAEVWLDPGLRRG